METLQTTREIIIQVIFKELLFRQKKIIAMMIDTMMKIIIITFPQLTMTSIHMDQGHHHKMRIKIMMKEINMVSKMKTNMEKMITLLNMVDKEVKECQTKQLVLIPI